jgi:hypothetical protein
VAKVYCHFSQSRATIQSALPKAIGNTEIVKGPKGLQAANVTRV